MSGTWADAIRCVFINASDEFCEYVLWSRTAFPFAPKARILEQIEEFSEALKTKPADRDFCDHCNKLAEPGKWMCASCESALKGEP